MDADDYVIRRIVICRAQLACRRQVARAVRNLRGYDPSRGRKADAAEGRAAWNCRFVLLRLRHGYVSPSYANFNSVWCPNFIGRDLGEMPLCRSPRRKKILYHSAGVVDTRHFAKIRVSQSDLRSKINHHGFRLGRKSVLLTGGVGCYIMRIIII